MREFKIQLGKVLIAFSIVILFLGFSLSMDINKYQSNVIISGSGNELPDTTIEIDNTNNIPVDKPNTTGNNNDNNTVSGTSDNTNSNTDTNPVTPQITGGDTTSSTSPSPSVDTSIETYNNNLRSTIQSTYGVTIKYGEETDDYKVGGLSVVSDTDQWVIEQALLELQTNMALYPANFYGEMRNGGLPLTIALIKNYKSGDGKDTNVTGITEKTARNGVVISVALDFPFADSFNHEMYHYMEHYINSKGGTYSNWNSYNPNGFIYNHIDPQYSYDLTLREDAYFVNSYAQSYEYEDRASTFEYMMASNKISPLNQGNNIWKKAKLMCEMIDYYFTTVNDSTTEYWERFVYD